VGRCRGGLTHEFRLEVPCVGEEAVDDGECQGKDYAGGDLHKDPDYFAPCRLVFVEYDPGVVSGCRQIRATQGAG
jgi:hypothetical protein